MFNLKIMFSRKMKVGEDYFLISVLKTFSDLDIKMLDDEIDYSIGDIKMLMRFINTCSENNINDIDNLEIIISILNEASEEKNTLKKISKLCELPSEYEELYWYIYSVIKNIYIDKVAKNKKRVS